jgi:hypothetical protein
MKTNCMPISQEEEKKQQKMEKMLHNIQLQEQDETKDVGGLGNS